MFNKINKLQKSGKILDASTTHLVFHAAVTSFSDLSKSSFVCLLAGLAGQLDVVCSVEPQ